MHFPLKTTPKRTDTAFSLVELMVATVVLLIIMVVLLQLTGGVGNVWRSSTGKISAFQNARSAFATIKQTLGCATLNSYNDYVDASSNYRNAANAVTFSPAKYLRASELHFVSGSASQLIPGADAVKNPGHAVFFQAAMGKSDLTTLNGLNRTLNSTGFAIQYCSPDDALLPDWLKPLFGVTKRFRLVQFIEPTESLKVYASTAAPGYDLDWLQTFKAPADPEQPRPRVLAEDIVFLVIRPRLAPKDEEKVAASLQTTFSAATQGSILCPNYHYDSRVWEQGYPPGQRVMSASAGDVRKELMRNQLPPIVDVAMVSVDRRSIARFDQRSDTPPAPLQVPPELFIDSSKLEADLETYGRQLSGGGIRYRVFRASIEIKGTK